MQNCCRCNKILTYCYEAFLILFPVSCLLFNFTQFCCKMSKLKKIVDELKDGTEIDVVDKGIVNFVDVPGLCKSDCIRERRLFRNSFK